MFGEAYENCAWSRQGFRCSFRTEGYPPSLASYVGTVNDPKMPQETAQPTPKEMSRSVEAAGT